MLNGPLMQLSVTFNGAMASFWIVAAGAYKFGLSGATPLLLGLGAIILWVEAVGKFGKWSRGRR